MNEGDLRRRWGIPIPADEVDLKFSVALYGGRLATVKVPIPVSKQNLERLKRMIEHQLEPFVDLEDSE